VTKSSGPALQKKPFLRGAPFLRPSSAEDQTRLTTRQRETLARIAMKIRLPARRLVYAADTSAEWVFAVAEGVVKCYRELPSGKRAVCAFLFPRDLFGLAENGRYVNSAQTVTPVTLFRLPLPELAHLLRHDGDLQFHFLSKITHELRESHRRSVVLGRRDAAGRLAMFLSIMADHGTPEDKRTPFVALPMTKSDIAGFLNLSLESVSRACAELEREGIVTFKDRHCARILNGPRFSRLVAAC
jgi:CRP-like cAMP-binding protein